MDFSFYFYSREKLSILWKNTDVNFRRYIKWKIKLVKAKLECIK